MYAKRLGKFSEDSDRTILVKFRNCDLKFELFKSRDQLRGHNIRLANEKTSLEKLQLDNLKKSGKSGYFYKGKLVVRENDHNSTNKTRIFRKAQRKQVQAHAGNESDMELDNTLSNSLNVTVDTGVG